MHTAKSFDISKHVVWDAYERVKSNKGAAGVDDKTIFDFEEDLKDNLFKIWNRMSSGSYFPPPVRLVEIPKKTGGARQLGVPTVSDRIAQMVAKIYLEPQIEPYFHEDSYGYRPNKSALDAVEKTRQRCWKYNWVIDMDIKSFFDNLNHDLVMLAVRKHTDSKWLLLYIERWLKAPLQKEDGTLVIREKGTPQGGVISPLIANLFLHYAFDKWMVQKHSGNPFERYADDIIVHCKSQDEAIKLLEDISARFAQCGLELHPGKTKIVYCKDDDRDGKHENESFDFLGYTFRARKVQSRSGGYFTGFNPAISNTSAKMIRQKMRGWKFHLWSDKSIHELAAICGSVIRGWINYYGRFYKSRLYSVLRHLNVILKRWAMRTYKTLKGSKVKASKWLAVIAKSHPKLFPHWNAA